MIIISDVVITTSIICFRLYCHYTTTVAVIRPVSAVTNTVITISRYMMYRSAAANYILVSVYLWPKIGLLDCE